MATELNKEEARLVGVLRAIKDFNREDLIDSSDVGLALEALQAVFDLDKRENELSSAQLKALLVGFVAGLAASRASGPDPDEYEYIQQPVYTPGPEADYEQTPFTGGPSGGVAVGQGSDPRYVTQSGGSGDNKEAEPS